MRIARLGEVNKEKPAVVISDTEAVFVDDLITDFNRAELENGAIAKLQKADLSTRAKVRISDYRIGSPVARPTKVICVGLNYAKHAFESFMELKAGDVVNTGTPEGVGMRFKPERFLKGGEVIITTIEGIGMIKNKVVNFK